MGCICSLIGASGTDYKIVPNFDFLSVGDSKLEPLISKDRKFRKNVENCVTEDGTNFLSHICEERPELLSLLIKHKMINKKAILYTDNEGRNFMHHLLNNSETSTTVIKCLKNFRVFDSNKDQIFGTYDNKGNTPLLSCVISGKCNLLLPEILPMTDMMRWFDKNRDGSSVFSLCLMNRCNDTIRYILNYTSKITKIIKDTRIGRYSDALEYSLYNNHEVSLHILNSPHYDLLKYNVYSYKDKDGDVVYGNHFNLACALKNEHYVIMCCRNGYVDKYDVKNNFSYISKILDMETIMVLMEHNLVPHDSIYTQDENGYTPIAWSLERGTDLYKYYLQNEQIDEKLASIKNEYGDNLVTLAAAYDIGVLMYLFNKYNSNFRMMFNVNNDGKDFIDILMESAKDTDEYPYIYNIIDVDNKEQLVRRYETCRTQNSTEIASLRYIVGYSVDLKDDREKLLNDNDEVICPVCFTDVNYVRLGCNHTICLKCSLVLDDCPICRDRICNRKILISIV